MAQAVPQDLAALAPGSASVKHHIETSFLEGHDADISSNDTAAVAAHHGHSAAGADLEAASIGSASARDTDEKAGPAHDYYHNQGRNHDGDGAKDPNIVDWDGPHDPGNPMNWPARKKWFIVAVVSSISFATPLASSMFAPGVPELMHEFNSSSTLLASFVVSVFLVGTVCGPLAIAPLSELYGRMIAYNVANVVFLAFTIGCALSTNLAMLCVFRLFMGIAGSTPLVVGGGTIADLIPQEKRGGALAIWALGPLMGPVIGPIIGGYLTEYAGWRWVFWLLSIITGVLTISCFFLMRETYGPYILSKRCRALRKSTNNPNLHTTFDGLLTPGELFRKAIIRPMKMLTRSPIVFFLSLHVAIVFSYLYLLFTTFTYVFERQYGFSPGDSGLTFLGVGVGMLSGLLIAGKMSDRIMKKRAAANGGQMKPEFRLPLMLPGAVCVPIGLFWYGWSVQANVHWIVPIIGTVLIGLGLLGTFMPVQTYFVDAFTIYAASATAASTVMRSLFGAFIPLAGQDLYAKLGYGWGNSLLAFIALAMVPVPFLFIKYGERLRTRSTVKF